MKTAMEILNECFLGVIDFNEEAAISAMEQYASQKAQAFAIWVEKNCVAVSPRKWEKVIEPDSGFYTVKQLYKMFYAEHNNICSYVADHSLEAKYSGFCNYCLKKIGG